MFLLDTCILSELRKQRIPSNVSAWLQKHKKAEMYLSVVTIGEIEAGVAKQRKSDLSFAASLDVWLDEVIDYYGERILPITVDVARIWGNFDPASGNATDKLIAATAKAHGLKIVTRNHRHFAPLAVAVVNPFGE
ncbi:MAG: type II toxin-antitoxin system VapC family toxin [Alphaproteobacteria bacterium]|nr:type II toxin-antitoxin system VapC family toxin [Alphaproteobacteria bacterium]